MQDLVAFVPRIEATSAAALHDYWTVVVRNTLERASDRLLAHRREVAARRTLSEHTTVWIDPPNTAVTSVSRVTSKGDEYARVRALLPALDPLDEEIFIRCKLLDEEAERIALDFGHDGDWVRRRAARVYARLFTLIGKSREGRLREVLRELAGGGLSRSEPIESNEQDRTRSDDPSRSSTPPLATR